ncbi:glycosyltransferase family 2 protein [Halorhodospira sp. 9621]|uniref:glycosyltransferase family 2 protein n=1 Tax=Halorhodospira sp. 9621 TaxID=2899135 RepID=UPI001EE875E6|nr:glycosyltransferase family 2 protein [Halorhodospira sp. 9621]
MISVIVPTCDRSSLLARALSDLAQQTRPPDEVLVVDNGREPASVAGSTLPLRVLRAPVRCGAAQARNIGATAAGGDWLVFLDDDDRWAPDYLEKLAAAIQGTPGAAAHMGRLQILDRRGALIREKLFDPRRAHQALYRIGIGSINFAVRREVFLRVGGFDARLPSAEDSAFLWTLHQAGERIEVDARAVAQACSHPGARLSDAPNILRGEALYFWFYRGHMTITERLLKCVDLSRLLLLYLLWKAGRQPS